MKAKDWLNMSPVNKMMFLLAAAMKSNRRIEKLKEVKR
jgi:hypothetical protein